MKRLIIGALIVAGLVGAAATVACCWPVIVTEHVEAAQDG